MPEVKLVNVTKRYGEIMANDRVSLTIRNGEYVSVIGPSGCGKTTLIKGIAGIIRPDEGEIYIGGRLVNQVPIEEREIGYVFQNIALFPHMDVWGNVTYGPRVKCFPPEETRPLAIEVLEMVKLSGRRDAYPRELSGGAQQKTAVARALASRAGLLLLDEPLGALDVKVRSVLRHELRRLVKDLNLTALHVTHDQEEAMSISDRVVVMKKGRIVEAGEPIELYTRPKNLFTANFVGEANFLSGVVTEVSREGSIIEVARGIRLLTLEMGHGVGDRVVTVFRPEFVGIGGKGVNFLHGTVADVVYSGSIGRVMVRLANGAVVVAKKALSPGESGIRVGDEVVINISPEHVLLYPYPRGGLERELALE